MYDGTFVQDFNPYEVVSTRRNPILADLFARMDLMERRGSGLRKIIEAYQTEENYKEELKPQFKSTESHFRIILKNLNYDTQSIGQNDGQKLNPINRRKRIIIIIEVNSKITASDLSKEFNISIRTIERDLKILTDLKLIEYVGSVKNGYWKIKNKEE